MLSDAGSIASLVGVVISLGGLGFAIWQLLRLRGEARAAREAAAATERALRRRLASTELTRLGERIQSLIEAHRRGDRTAALAGYSEILELFLEIRRSHPALSEEHRVTIQRAITDIAEMERSVEKLGGDIPQELASSFNHTLRELQLSVIPQLEDQLN
jgi:hypothetical protein